MSRKYPLSYPAPDQKHFHAKRTPKAPRDYYDLVFCSSFIQGPFKKFSIHGTTPILVGALIAATGSLQMIARSIGVLICALWLSLDIGAWISATRWKQHYKVIGLCTVISLL